MPRFEIFFSFHFERLLLEMGKVLNIASFLQGKKRGRKNCLPQNAGKTQQTNEKNIQENFPQCNVLTLYSFIGTISKELALMDAKEK